MLFVFLIARVQDYNVPVGAKQVKLCPTYLVRRRSPAPVGIEPVMYTRIYAYAWYQCQSEYYCSGGLCSKIRIQGRGFTCGNSSMRFFYIVVVVSYRRK